MQQYKSADRFPTKTNSANWIVAALAAYAFLGGVTTLIGWFAHAPHLTDWLGSGISMFANTALAATCAGAALLLSLIRRRWGTQAAAALGGIVALIGGATLFEHLTGIDLGIDTLLVKGSWGVRAAAAPGRMGPPGATSFTILGIAVVLLANGGRGRKAVPGLGIAACLIAMLALTGYAFGADPLYSLTGLTGIAMQTATVILALGLAVLARQPDLEPVRTLGQDTSAGLLSRGALPFVIGLPIVLGALGIHGQKRGWFDTGLGTAILVLTLITILFGMVWWCAAVLTKHERISEESHARFRSYFDLGLIGMAITSPTKGITEVNDELCKCLGYDRNDLLRMTWAQVTHPEDLAADEKQFNRVLAGAIDGYFLDKRFIRKDGQTIFATVSTKCVRREDHSVQYFVALLQDITERKRADDALRQFVAIVESSDDAIISKDLNGVIQTWNRGAERIFGYSAAEAIGKPVAMLIPVERLDEEPNILARLRKGERIDHYETIRRRKDGTLVDISLTVSPIRRADGRVIGASKIGRDITELRKNRLALAKSHEDLEQRIAERTASLRQAVAQMEEFSYSVSHDLRAPVRAMKGYAEATLEDYGDRLDDKGREYLNRILRGSSRMDQLIHDVLTYSRLARFEIQLQPVSLQKLLHDVIQQYPEMQAPRAEIAIREPLHEVLAHEPSLTQAVSNLLANGVKFVAPGTTPRLEVWTERRNGAVRLWVEDNGIGINPKYQARLFGMFERVNQNARYEGNGIGLAIVRKAAEKMGGSVGVESDGAAGSSFWIELPAAHHQ